MNAQLEVPGPGQQWDHWEMQGELAVQQLANTEADETRQLLISACLRILLPGLCLAQVSVPQQPPNPFQEPGSICSLHGDPGSSPWTRCSRERDV